MDIFIDDAIRKLLEMRNDGYFYCSVDIFPADEDCPAVLSFEALECGGDGAISYDDDEETAVYAVPEDELDKYADRYMTPAPNRKVIKKIDITY